MTLAEAERRSSAGILADALRSSTLVGLRVIWWAVREVWWWCRRLAQLLVWNPLLMVVWSLSVGWLGAWTWSEAHGGSVDEPTVVALAGLVVPVWVAGLWLRFAPMSYQARVVVPAWRRRVERGVRSGWVVLMDTCGLGRRVVTPQGVMTQVPQLAVACWRDNDLWIQPALLPGQTLDDVEAVAERLRVTVHATRLRVVAGPNFASCWLVWSFEDRLARPFPAHVPAADDVLSLADLRRVPRGGGV